MAVSSFVCSAHVIDLCLKALRKKTWDRQIYTHTSILRVSYLPRIYTNSPGRPNRKHTILTLQWIEASELFDNSNNSPRHSASFQRNKGTEAAPNTSFLQE
jgi:hypothetical protein